MPARRILSLWFPRLAAERLLRLDPGLAGRPVAVVRDDHNRQLLAALSATAGTAGLTPGQALRDALAICPGLVTRAADPVAEAAFLATLRRWAGKFSPWVGEEGADGLVLDITGCAHLFGGEAALTDQVERDCAGLGLSVQAGIADTVGAAWALARFAGSMVSGGRSGDAIDQEARATRSRAAKGGRHWTRGGAPPAAPAQVAAPQTRIAPPGATHRVLAPLPVTALRLESGTAAALNRLGLRRIGDILGMPRAGLARRFGQDLVRRLDQALGSEPEPVSPARPPLHFAVRMSLPEPVGLEDDILAGIDRLLPALCDRLRAQERGARALRLELGRTDHTHQAVDLALARATAEPDRIGPLIAMKLDVVEAGFGIDRLRLVATAHEALPPRQRAMAGRGGEGTAMADLIGRIGARLGLEAITRLCPADSHIPEKAALVMAAAWSEPATDWADRVRTTSARPLLLWRPEPVMVPDSPVLPPRFRWRGGAHEVAALSGPERIAPEWWLDEAGWRTGARDYTRVTTAGGARLWLYYAHGAALSPGWFCQGSFG